MTGRTLRNQILKEVSSGDFSVGYAVATTLALFVFGTGIGSLLGTDHVRVP